MKKIFWVLAVVLLICQLPLFAQASKNTGIYDLVKNKLVVLDGKKISDFKTTALAHTKYFALYYSAEWCQPCHIFTPELVAFYQKFKPSHPNFELVFVSLDNDEDSMAGYMREMSMPWPAVKFDDLSSIASDAEMRTGFYKYSGDGIPDLVLVGADGKVLSDSFVKGEYVGPEVVINDIQLIVK